MLSQSEQPLFLTFSLSPIPDAKQRVIAFSGKSITIESTKHLTEVSRPQPTDVFPQGIGLPETGGMKTPLSDYYADVVHDSSE